MTTHRHPRRGYTPAHRSGLRSYQQAFFRRTWLAVSAALLLSCALVGFAITLVGVLFLQVSPRTAYEIVENNRPYYSDSPVGPLAAAAPLSAVFTGEIHYWEALIKIWAATYEVDPNLIATLIQIESCGDPLVASPAGAQGLFQVMPFHFAQDEDMLDVQTNARRGMNYLITGLEKADGHAGLALAGYNGGHGIIDDGWASWSGETRRYYYWGARIYAESISGMETSPTLTEWLNAGGQNLCLRASQSQRMLDEQQQEQNTQANLSLAAN